MLKLFPSLIVFVQYAGISPIAKAHKGFCSVYIDTLGTLLDWKPVRALQICDSIGWNSPGHDKDLSSQTWTTSFPQTWLTQLHLGVISQCKGHSPPFAKQNNPTEIKHKIFTHSVITAQIQRPFHIIPTEKINLKTTAIWGVRVARSFFIIIIWLGFLLHARMQNLGRNLQLNIRWDLKP